MNWMILPLRRYVDFTGRSRRLEFWMFQLFNLLVYGVLIVLTLAGFPWSDFERNAEAVEVGAVSPLGSLALLGPLFWIGAVLMLIWGLATFIPALAVTVRRLHDRGVSGWWYAGLLIAGLIPLVNVIAFFGYFVLLVFLVLPGKPEANKWGPNPKDPGQASVFE